MISVGSLFSGIGGLDLGLERGMARAGVGSHVSWQVEAEPFCRAVLARHWPNAGRHPDVRGFHPEPVDVVCGGFPCQDVSVAGKGAGLDGERSGLWWEFHRVVQEVRPRVVVIENVPALVSRGLSVVVGALDALGYVGTWDVVSAAGVGAPHLRRRLFVVAADPDRVNLRILAEREPWRRARELCGRGQAEPVDDGEGWPFALWNGGAPESWCRRVDDGLFAGLDGYARRGLKDSARFKALGNAVVPEVAEVAGVICGSLLRPTDSLG